MVPASNWVWMRFSMISRDVGPTKDGGLVDRLRFRLREMRCSVTLLVLRVPIFAPTGVHIITVKRLFNESEQMWDMSINACQ